MPLQYAAISSHILLPARLSVPSIGAMPLQFYERLHRLSPLYSFSPLNRGNASTIAHPAATMLSLILLSPPSTGAMPLQSSEADLMSRLSNLSVPSTGAMPLQWLSRTVHPPAEHLSVPSTGAMPLQLNPPLSVDVEISLSVPS